MADPQLPLDPPPAAPPGGDPWFAAYPDEVKGYVTNRGLDKLDRDTAFQKIVENHRNAEKMMGAPAAELVRIPKPDAPAADWDAYHLKLGRPETVDKYELPVTDANKERAAAFAQAAFKNGTPKDKAQALWKEITDYDAKLGTDADSRAKADLTNEVEGIRKSWGKDFDAKYIVAERAVEAYAKANGQNPDEARANFKASMDKPGFSAAWNMFLFFGQRMGEDKFIPGGIPPNSLYTKESALSRITDLKNDPAWVKKFTANDANILAEFRALVKIAYPDEQQRRSA